MPRDIEKYTQKYLTEDFNSFESYMVKFRRNKVLEILAKYQPKNILEIGCGMESIAKYYKDFEYFTIVEPSKTFADKAKDDLLVVMRGAINIINDFIQPQVTSLKQNCFDFVLLSSLLHEVENPKNFLNEILPLLTPQTILHINVPNSNSFHLLWAYESGLIPQLGSLSATAKSLQQHTAFSIESLCSLVEKLGLEIVESGSYFIKLFNHTKMSLALQNGILDEKLLNGLEKMVQYMPELGAEIFVNVRVR